MSDSLQKYALVGAAGFVAPRHMQAMQQTGGQLMAALDPSDSVGIMDSYFPEARFFVEFERFDRHIDKLRREGRGVDYVSVCSPNYLHDAHVRFGLRSDANVICEKPLVLNTWNIDGLREMEAQTGRQIFNILQLRLHPSIIELKQYVADNPDKTFDLELTYIASRGRWYMVSWKGADEKSGGVATNIGVHFFDMLVYVFGSVVTHEVHLQSPTKNAGFMQLERANVRWFLSVDKNDLPEHLPNDLTTYRSITVDGKEIEFSKGFKDLHTHSYEKILAGEGYKLDEVAPCIEIVSDIRNMAVTHEQADHYHPFVKSIIADEK